MGFGATSAQGILADLARWAGRTQDRDIPRQFHRPRVILLSDPRPIDEPADLGGEQLASLADAAGVQIGVQAAVVPPRHDALHADDGTPSWARSVVAWAIELIDAEVDAGAGVLILTAEKGGAGDARLRSHSAGALALVSLLCRVEPSALMRYDVRRDDDEWMRELSQMRDARRDAALDRRTVGHSTIAVGSPVLLAAAAMLLHAARRRTPVILDGLPAAAGALTANTLAPGAVGWWRIAGASNTPADQPISARLGLVPLLPSGDGAPAGAAGVLAWTALRLAIATAEAA
jgi:nicotinate-nucleotide--dimethylbenzimidazole phosphoribosyltransferase